MNTVSSQMPESMKKYFNDLVEELDQDKAQMQQDGESLIALKDSLNSAKGQMNKLISQIQTSGSDLDTKIGDLSCKIETLNNQNINSDNVRSFFNFTKKNLLSRPLSE